MQELSLPLPVSLHLQATVFLAARANHSCIRQCLPCHISCSWQSAHCWGSGDLLFLPWSARRLVELAVGWTAWLCELASGWYNLHTCKCWQVVGMWHPSICIVVMHLLSQGFECCMHCAGKNLRSQSRKAYAIVIKDIVMSYKFHQLPMSLLCSALQQLVPVYCAGRHLYIHAAQYVAEACFQYVLAWCQPTFFLPHNHKVPITSYHLTIAPWSSLCVLLVAPRYYKHSLRYVPKFGPRMVGSISLLWVCQLTSV